MATGAQMRSSQRQGVAQVTGGGRDWDEGSNHQEGNGNHGKKTEGISGNRIKLVTAIKLQPQNLEQKFWLKKKGRDSEFILLLRMSFMRGY